jgi:signal transduction histidine kinase
MFNCKDRQHPYFCTDEQAHRDLHAKLLLIHERHHEKFLQHYRYFRYMRPAVILFNLVILYLLFSWVGFKGIGIFFAALIIIKEILHFLFLLRVERRIFMPMKRLQQGLDEVAKGNYNVKVEYDRPNDLGLLIASFNEMTEKLYETEKMQAEYEENRNSLIANISHDLKTPITAIQGYIEALLDGTVITSENRDKYLKTIHHNTVYVNNLIDDLFLFSKLDMQKLEFRFEETQIRSFMDDLMEEYRFDLAERKIRFDYISRLEIDCRVNLDSKRFHQAFNNIISNAVQHGAESDLSIQVELYHQDGFIRITISDNGPGIPEDKLPFIFDRFYRIDTERPKEFQSTGLGLAIAKELIEAHGGKISVSSVSGDTRFTIMLPIIVDSEMAGR